MKKTQVQANYRGGRCPKCGKKISPKAKHKSQCSCGNVLLAKPTVYDIRIVRVLREEGVLKVLARCPEDAAREAEDEYNLEDLDYEEDFCPEFEIAGSPKEARDHYWDVEAEDEDEDEDFDDEDEDDEL